MPIYEYRCESCSAEFEEFLRAGDEEPSECPECSATSVKRLISDTSFKLKGSGWYETDYARSDEPQGAETEPDGAESEQADDVDAGTDSDASETSDE